MNKVLVTGAAGFLGSHLIDGLLEQGYKVCAVDKLAQNDCINLKHLKLSDNFSYYKVDVKNFDELDKIFDDDFCTIYHYASVVGVKNYLLSPKDVINVSIIGTQNIIDLAQKYKAKIIFASTSEVYGKNPNIPWKETDDRVLGSTEFERWTYSSSKAVAEHLIISSLKNTDIDWLIVRYFNVYGPRQNTNFVIASNLKNYFFKKPLICHNNGLQTRCYTFVDDAIDATIRLAQTHHKGIYNIGSNIETNINELLQTINKVDKHKLEIQSVNTSELLGLGFEDIPRRVPCVEKIKSAIGWSASTSLSNGLKKTYFWISDTHV